MDGRSARPLAPSSKSTTAAAATRPREPRAIRAARAKTAKRVTGHDGGDHSDSDDQPVRGRDALYQLLDWRQGRFGFRPSFVDAPTSFTARRPSCCWTRPAAWMKAACGRPRRRFRWRRQTNGPPRTDCPRGRPHRDRPLASAFVSTGSASAPVCSRWPTVFPHRQRRPSYLKLAVGTKPKPPKLLAGKYRMVEPIGQGAMAVVWRAELPGPGRQTAVGGGEEDEDRPGRRARLHRDVHGGGAGGRRAAPPEHRAGVRSGARQEGDVLPDHGVGAGHRSARHAGLAARAGAADALGSGHLHRHPGAAGADRRPRAHLRRRDLGARSSTGTSRRPTSCWPRTGRRSWRTSAWPGRWIGCAA